MKTNVYEQHNFKKSLSLSLDKDFTYKHNKKLQNIIYRKLNNPYWVMIATIQTNLEKYDKFRNGKRISRKIQSR